MPTYSRPSVSRAALATAHGTAVVACTTACSPPHSTDLENAKREIVELFAKITEIRRKAEHSEYMVEEICRDIKKLDYAKRHLTTTITALRRLSMLVNAVGATACIPVILHLYNMHHDACIGACDTLPTDQLQHAVERHEYAEAAQLLEAVQQLFAHFQAYGNVPKVRFNHPPRAPHILIQRHERLY